jgi:hypothetical protein
VGTIKGLGRIYQQAGVDAYSSFGFAKVYLDKKAESAIDFVKTKVQPVYEMFQIPLDRILEHMFYFSKLSERDKLFLVLLEFCLL